MRNINVGTRSGLKDSSLNNLLVCALLFCIGDSMDNYYMSIALKLAYKAYKKGEVPVGAVIVKNNKILSTAYNKKNKTKRTTDHAEILAIIKANKKLHDWRLNDCIMYVTLKPCDMCIGALKESRISKVIYACDTSCNSNAINCIQLFDKNMNKESSDLLKNFFSNRR